MPCVCGNGHIIRCAEVNRASRNVQKTILHLTALLTVHENAEALQLGIHVHACQRHTIPRLLLELAFVDPPAVDGRRTIDDASTDCEFRVGGQFRETNRGYGKLADWVCDGSGALLATAYRTEVSNSDDTVRLNNQHSRGLTVGHAAHAVDFNRRPILSRQNVLALFRIPTASTNRAAELHEYQRSGFDDGEPFAVVQGYGKLCSSNPHIHVAELFGEEPELLTRTVVPAVDPDVRAVFACLRVLDVEHESVFVCDCPIGFHPRAGKPYRLRRLTADQEYRRANRVDLVYGKLFRHPTAMRRGVG